MNRPASPPAAPLAPDVVTTRQATLESLRASEHRSCLLCSPTPERGPRLAFVVQPDGAVEATLTCDPSLQSYPDTLHGGVTAAILDAAMTNALFSIGVVGVTAELTVRYVASVIPDQSATVRAMVDRHTHPLFYVSAELRQDGEMKARASARFLIKGFAMGAPR